MNKSRGRPAGGSDARRRIVDAARIRFLADGYSGTSVRAIARDAGVDHALVNYYFGGKDGLFGEVMVLSQTPGMALVDTLRGRSEPEFARAILEHIFARWSDPAFAGGLRGMLLEASHNDAVRATVADYFERALVGQLTDALTGPRRDARARAGVMVIAGLVLGRFVFEVPAFTEMSREDVVRFYAPALAAALAARTTSRGSRQ